MPELSAADRTRYREAAERALAEQLQQVIRRHIDREQYTIEYIAEKMDVWPTSVNGFMQKETWTLGFCTQLMGVLDIQVRVTGRHV